MVPYWRVCGDHWQEMWYSLVGYVMAFRFDMWLIAVRDGIAYWLVMRLGSSFDLQDASGGIALCFKLNPLLPKNFAPAVKLYYSARAIAICGKHPCLYYTYLWKEAACNLIS